MTKPVHSKICPMCEGKGQFYTAKHDVSYGDDVDVDVYQCGKCNGKGYVETRGQGSRREDSV